MAVYDDQKTKPDSPSDDDLRQVTGISPDDEQGMEARAKSMSDDDLENAEEKAADPEAKAATEQESKEAGTVSNFKFTGSQAKKSKRGRNGLLVAGGGGGLFLLIGFLLIFILASQNKVVSFGHILAASGYARFNGIMDERMTQDVFDASVSEGGTTSLQGKSLLDRLTGKNLDSDLADLGRQDQFKLSYKRDGSLDSIKIGDQDIGLDGLTKELGFGDSYKSASLTERARVRFEFTERTQNAMGETFANEPKYLRSQAFDTIADNIGFKFSRWRQQARDYFGKSPADADIKNKVETEGEVGAPEPIETGSSDIDELTKAEKNENKFQEFLQKNGGVYDQDAWTEVIAKGAESGSKIQEAANTVAPALIIVTLSCMAHEAFGHVDDIYNQNVQEAERQGLAVLAGRDQTSGGYVVSEAVDAGGHQLDGSELSPYYQQAVGLPVEGTTDIPRIKPKIDPQFADFLKNITNPASYVPGLNLVPGARDYAGDKFCGFLLSPAGAAAAGVGAVVLQATVNFLTAGGAGILEEGGVQAALPLILNSLKTAAQSTVSGLFTKESLAVVSLFTAYSYGLKFVVNFLAGTAISGASDGATYYSTAALGTMLEQNTQMQTLYGKPCTADEAKQGDAQYTLLDKSYEANKSLTNRYFASSNPYSLMNIAITQTPSSLTSVVGGVRSSLMKVGSIFQPSTLISLIPGVKAHAAADTFDPYQGITQLCYSPDELQKMRYDPSYSVLANADRVSEDTVQKYDDKYAQCFDPTTKPSELLKLQENDGLCSAKELSQDSVFRYRLLKLDTVLTNLTSSTPKNTATNLTPGFSSAN